MTSISSPRASLTSRKSGSARRKFANGAMWAFCVLSTVLAIIPLVLVLTLLAKNGLGAILRPGFFTQVAPPAGETGGGMKHAIIGSLLIIGLASCIGLPFGILGGIYLSEFGKNRLGFCVRFAADVLNGVPSIIIGIVVYAIAVLPVTKATHGDISYSAWAGGLALGVMMIPTVMRTTEEILALVPMALREAALALGGTRWHTTLKVVLGAARGGVITGVLLAVARVSGETAPLIFTILGNNNLTFEPRHPVSSLSQPTAALPLQIFTFATSADPNWIRLAWGGSLILVLMILVLSLAARYFTSRQKTAR